MKKICDLVLITFVFFSLAGIGLQQGSSVLLPYANCFGGLLDES
jgi:hypothetical protein